MLAEGERLARRARVFGAFSATTGALAGGVMGHLALLIISALVALLVIALAFNARMRAAQQSGRYPSAWERWGAG